ncbi:hypothetical protein KRR26_26570 [Corallococcus sp. M34]|uniref:hypothetical protein n=1 Tax=Citreicoccus inhibens TaxID=2849499 RepID=UPI001C23D213|nr:hypothetical protein [Citreicoccus inhibens]MBU8899184.1 hypothetical protein [Citreicoccus inhibens]
MLPQTAAHRTGFLARSEFASPAPDIASTFRREFGALASDKKRFHDTMRTVFGDGYNAIQAENYRQKAQAGDYGWLPKVRLVSPETLGGAYGAYDSQSGTVFINQTLSPQEAASTFVEEAGHHLDTKLNVQDAAGDEGELFRRILSGEKLSPAQVNAIRAENDKGIIQVDGKATAVEFRGLFERIGNFFSDVGNAVGKAVSGVVRDVGRAVSGAVRAVGSAVSGAARAVGGFVSRAARLVGNAARTVARVVRTVGQRVGDGLHSLATGVVNSLKGSLRNIQEGARTFLSGFGKLIRGHVGEGLKQMSMGAVKTFIQTPIDVLLMSGGRTISAMQTLLGQEPLGRKLSSNEIATLRGVYGDSIDYSAVRLKEGKAGIFSAFGRAFTHGDTIYVPPDDLPLTAETLVHEAGHVWQHQNGGTDYMSEALVAQELGDGYKFEKALAAGKPWSQFNPEQQAEFLSSAQRAGYFDSPNSRFYVDGTDYTAELRAALAQVRAGQGAP